MPWHRTTPAHYHRPLGANEAFIRSVGQSTIIPHNRENWSISVLAHLKPHPLLDPSQNITLPQRIRQAWKALRFQHPGIATTSTDTGLEYHSTEGETDEEMEEWVGETVHMVQGEEVTAEDIIASMTASRYAKLYCLHPSPLATNSNNSRKPTGILLHLSHYRTDGLGALQLLSAYLSHLASSILSPLPSQPLQWGSELRRLLPSVEEALSLPTEPIPAISAAANKYVSTLAYTARAVPLPFEGDAGTAPQGTRSVRCRWEMDVTARLVKGCREKGVGLTSAVHAGVAEVAFALTPEEEGSEGREHVSTLRHGLKGLLPAPWTVRKGKGEEEEMELDNGCTKGGEDTSIDSTPESFNKDIDIRPSASGLYTGGYMVHVSPTSSFLSNARYYESEYQHGLTNDFVSSRREYAIIMGDVMRKRLQQKQTGQGSDTAPPPSGLDISSVGDAGRFVRAFYGCRKGERGEGKSESGKGEGLGEGEEREATMATGQALEVEGVSIGVETLSRHIYVFMWIFRGCLEFNIVYNEAFYKRAFVEGQICERLKGVLERELLGKEGSD